MEFDKTRLYCPWNSDKNWTQNSSRGLWEWVLGGGGAVLVGGLKGEVLGVQEWWRWGNPAVMFQGW